MSKFWVTFVHSTATAHAKCELDAVEDNFSSHLDWLSDLENLEHRHSIYTTSNTTASATPASMFEDQLFLKMATTASWDQKVPHSSLEEDQTNNEQDATIMENIQVSCKETSKTTSAKALSSGDIIEDPSRLADFIKDFFPDYQLEDIMSSPMKSQQNDTGLPSPPLSKPPSPIPPATGSITPTEESPCDTKHTQNLQPSDDPFREYFEEKLSASNWSVAKGARPPPPTYSKALPAKHKLLQQADVENVEAKKITLFTNSSDMKQVSKTSQSKKIDGSKLPKKHTVDHVHESMKSSLPHARLTTLAKYEIDVSAVPLKSRFLQMAEKADAKQGKPSLSKGLPPSEKRTSQALSMERINRLAQPKRTFDKPADGSKSVNSSSRTALRTSTKTTASQKSQGAKHLGVSQIRQKRSQPMSLTAAAIALNSAPVVHRKTTRSSADSGSVTQEAASSNEPEWARSSNLETALEEQSKVDPDEIFGKFTTIDLDDVFRSKPSKLPSPSRPFRIRVNSCMTRVTHQEEAAYRVAMGYAVC
ncbi:hypothetical protein K450DRAFT_261405 [Umbelopsis ramanniana AG]|uniref:Inner centromere protein ARK-binding domain-containing protein n=1 Tax=Umbelopsis ramanniana AG TaxID=1314678 RepID=A0AAD5H8C4_UMBRA|nr:uncharacterized protein K450DRAFT_261405 [Umbelopsis ramanniana AG]KAI8575537.1 hypothetical protein K450DRAFT_261405 [Umbelopsis ramanniana AG]